MADFHGIEVTRVVSGARPFRTPGQSMLGVIVSANLDADGKYGNGTSGIYNRAYRIDAPPSEDDFTDTTGTWERVFDQIFKNGRVPVQAVFVEVGSAQSARAEQTFSEGELAAATVDTKAELDALPDYSFTILTLAGQKYLAFGGGSGVVSADVTKFNTIKPGDSIVVKVSGGGGNALESYTAESTWSTASNWIRVDEDADVGSLSAGTDYEVSAPPTLARTADENEYDNLYSVRQAAQTGIYAVTRC